MNAQEAFRIGFVSRCVEDGCALEDVPALAKRAADMLGAAAEDVKPELLRPFAKLAEDMTPDFEKASLLQQYVTGPAKDLWSMVKDLGVIGGVAAVGAPALAGGALGVGAAKLTEPNIDINIADVQREEQVDEYRRQTEKLKREKSFRDYRRALNSQQRSARPLL